MHGIAAVHNVRRMTIFGSAFMRNECVMASQHGITGQNWFKFIERQTSVNHVLFWEPCPASS